MYRMKLQKLAKRGVILFLIAAIVVISYSGMVFSEENKDWFYKTKDTKIIIDISSEISINEIQEDAYLESLQLNLSFIPRQDWRQNILSLNTQPHAKIGDTAVFTWEQPTERQFSFSLNAEVATKDGFLRIRDKTPFPVHITDPEMLEYTLPQENINSDNALIIKLASELAAGEDDAYIIIFKIANWVSKNIEYSLDSLTAELSQKASWVLMNREGVCDEITSLFIAMTRSLGIPARYVSGIAYTNWNEINDFGLHAWAEVYLPEIGWIPYDVTYGEFGFIDTSHISLKTSYDAGSSPAKYKWLGRNVQLQTKLSINAETKHIGEKLKPYVSVIIKPLKDSIDFGSYNLIEVIVKNDYDFYVPVELTLSNTEGMAIQGDNRKNVLLLPGSTATEYWIVSISKTLDRNFIYSFPVTAYTLLNATSIATFKAAKNEPAFTKEEIEMLLEQFIEEDQKTYSSEVSLTCETDKTRFYMDEQTTLNCQIKNTGNTYLENVNVCFRDNCRIIDVGITQEEELSFQTNYEETGSKEAVISAKNNEITKTATVELEVLDRPSVKIEKLQYPKQITMDDTYRISFTLSKQSHSLPKNVKVTLDDGNSVKDWNLKQLENNREFVLTLNAQKLEKIDNEYAITVQYEDEQVKTYEEKTEFTIQLKDVTFAHKLIMLFNRFGRNLTSFDLKVLIIAAFVFGIAGGYIIHITGKRRGTKLEEKIDTEIKKEKKEEKKILKEEKKFDKGIDKEELKEEKKEAEKEVKSDQKNKKKDDDTKIY